MSLAVGKDLFAMCGKCDATWHVIVAMEGAKVTKVQCKQCMGYHRYRVPPGEVNVNKTATKRGATTRRRVASSTRSRARRKVDSPLIEPNLELPVRDYAISGSYEVGERIEHPKFGQGVVEQLTDAGKMNVFFEDGRRTLIYGR